MFDLAQKKWVKEEIRKEIYDQHIRINKDMVEQDNYICRLKERINDIESKESENRFAREHIVALADYLGINWEKIFIEDPCWTPEKKYIKVIRYKKKDKK